MFPMNGQWTRHIIIWGSGIALWILIGNVLSTNELLLISVPIGAILVTSVIYFSDSAMRR
jgi:hypothetical protein